MTAAAANRNTPQLAGLGQWPAALTIKDNEILFAGVMLAVDATPEVVEASDTAALKVVGRNPKYVDNTDDGKTVVPEFGVFKYANDVSNPVVEGAIIGYVKDDQTVCATAGSTNKITAGLVVRVESDGVWMCQTLEALRIAQAIHDAGDASATTHIADAAQTQDALVDNGGGTADGTVAAQAAPVTLTDNTGDSATHDDTLAVVTSPTLSDWNGSSVHPSAAQGTAIVDAIAALRQNESDLAQKVIEIVTLQGTAQNNLKEVTTEFAKIKTDVGTCVTKINAILAALETQNVLKSS